MPWKPEDAPRHDKDASTPKKRRMWSKIANAALKRALEKGEPEKEAKVSAIRQASGTVESLQRRPLLTLSEGDDEMLVRDNRPSDQAAHARLKKLSANAFKKLGDYTLTPVVRRYSGKGQPYLSLATGVKSNGKLTHVLKRRRDGKVKLDRIFRERPATKAELDRAK